ncbi:alpha/beta hydrolase family esterase [Actinomadura macrotermitis]|uniref:Polyhydroxybutyrate depolymerase n=1 Tax=Actinomadura macrotermitis TaxID=2585200 RepID=A0A7K0BWG8_9ACTN|nr:PHB depolymerase family esterase [Actinomadura macrotermitis]MQY05525.1 hypothetical protein [Actinomadura macrotermitis]
MIRSWALAVAAALALGGCAGTRPAAVAPAPSPTCMKPSTGRQAFAGRPYLLAVPKDYGRAPLPVIVDLHGLRSNGFEQAVYARLANAGPARGFIVVEPAVARGRQGWKLPGMTDGGSDTAYIGALLDHLEKTLCVDRRREYAAGFSNGAGLAAALVCGLNGRLAGVAPVAGVNLARPCARPRPTTLVAFHGTGDPIVPYEGGAPFGGDRTRIPAWMRPASGVFALPGVPAVTAGWARAFGCGKAARDRPGSEITRTRYPRCRDGARVELYTVAGGGHTWPGSIPIGAGKTTTQIDATRLILDAFSKS